MNGKVLVVGGHGSTAVLDSTELYDPSIDIWATVQSMNNSRIWHTASRLTNGKILVAGGSVEDGRLFLDSAELYTSSTKTLTSIDKMINEEDNVKPSI
jgi:hypothetical protein